MGWTTPTGKFLCAHCAGRIIGRGAWLPQNSEPQWHDSAATLQPCCVCDK
jgi:hypothetical protein